MMMRTFVALAIVSVLTATLVGVADAQQNGSARPVVKVQAAPWIPTPQLPPSIFPATPSFSGAGSDFFPAAPTNLFNNTDTGTTVYYFPVSNITMDDANIPNSLDSDGDNTYYITQIDIGIFVPGSAQQPVQAEFYIGTDPTNPSQIATFDGQLNPGTNSIISIIFPRCQPYEMAATPATGSNGNPYDRFWVGVKFPQYCAPLYSGGGPGWLLAAGPDHQEDVFYWQGDTNCGGSYLAAYYYFGGNPRGSFYIKVIGAATFADAVTNPDIDGNGCVDDADLLRVLFAFGSTGSNLDEDVNCDGVVDDADLLAVLFNFGSGC